MDERDAPAAMRAPDSRPYPDDTVSLRELYLVWRAGLGLIIAVTVVCALLAAAFKLYQGRKYTAEAVVQVVRPRVSNQPGTGLEVSVASAMDAGTYEAAAMNARTLAAAADALESTEGSDLGDVESVDDLGALAVVTGPGPESGDAITLTHRVTVDAAKGPSVAAAVANAWAEATITAVRDLVTAPLVRVGEGVASDVAAREQAYQEASEAWADFLGVDEREELRRRLDALVDLDAQRLGRLGEVEAEIAAVNARLEAAQGAADAQLRSDLAALRAEADHLRSELTASGTRGDELRARIGELEREAAQLQRDVSAASLSYFRAAPAATEIALQRELAAGSVSMAIPASPPLQADSRNVVTTVVGAALVGALLSTLLVFLRAAVREPEPA